MDPSLDTTTLPHFAELTQDRIVSALDDAIVAQQAIVQRLIMDRPTDFSSAWLPCERSNIRLESIWSAVSHLNAVADTPELRIAYAEGERRVVDNGLQVGQNRALYDLLVALTTSSDFAALPVADRVAVEHAVREFTLSGVALDTGERDRFRAILVELSDLSTRFGSEVLDATDP